jgi:hypothetical protein
VRRYPGDGGRAQARLRRRDICATLHYGTRPMVLPANHPGASRDSRSQTRILLWLIWCVAVLTLGVAFGMGSLSPDDAMRLVEVRDLLAGQNWFDLTQYRLDPPNGVVTHWSRLVDLPLAVLIQAGKTLLPEALAEQIAMAVWPAALLLAFLAGISQFARDLAGETAARVALVFAALMAPVLQHFRPGSIHHHNVQLVLIIWSLAFFVRMPSRPRDSAIAGILCALSVAVGQEMVPAIAVLATVVGLRWIVEGERCARTTIAYAVSLATGAVVLAAATIAPANYLIVHCDAISIAQVGALGLGGFGLSVLAALPRLNSIAGRLVAAGGLAILLAASIKFGAPQCLADPYAQLDPRLADLWLSSVAEARSLFSTARDMPQQIPAYFGVPLAALLLGTIRCLRENGQQRWNWVACTAVQAAFILVSVWELRGTGSANALGAALLPAALLQMLPEPKGRASYFGIPRAALVAMLLLNPVVLLALGNGAARAFDSVAVTTQRIVTSGDAGTCQRQADYKPLAKLPRGRILAFIDSGPFILMESEHAALGAPYHRNETGNLAILDMFLASPNDAKVRMAARGIDYVAFCPGAPERYDYVAYAPNGLAATLAEHNIPGFLEGIPLAGTDLTVYRVLN